MFEMLKDLIKDAKDCAMDACADVKAFGDKSKLHKLLVIAPIVMLVLWLLF